MKTVLRTIFYQFLVLFIGVSIGFIINAEWIGWNSHPIKKSINNILFPVEFDEKTCQKIKNYGKIKIYNIEQYPKKFRVLEDAIFGEEFYVCKFEYEDESGKMLEKISSTRVRWKPWEYYWSDLSSNLRTEEDLMDYLKEGTLNSTESDKAMRLYSERANK